MNKMTKNLKKKFSKCRFFIVLATRNYLKDLRNDDREILTQISVARELNMPFFVIIDRRMSQNDTEEIRKYFSKDNVVKELVVDIGSENSAMIVASEIRHMMECMYPCEDKAINIVKQDSIEKD